MGLKFFNSIDDDLHNAYVDTTLIICAGTYKHMPSMHSAKVDAKIIGIVNVDTNWDAPYITPYTAPEVLIRYAYRYTNVTRKTVIVGPGHSVRELESADMLQFSSKVLHRGVNTR